MLAQKIKTSSNHVNYRDPIAIAAITPEPARAIRAFGSGPAAERRWWVGFRDFAIVLKALRINSGAKRPDSYDHGLA